MALDPEFADWFPSLTDSEKALVKLFPTDGFWVFRNRNISIREAKLAYPDETANRHQDAYRHASWMALTARDIGQTFAELFGLAHEGFPGNDLLQKQMYLHNNSKGIAAAYDSNPAQSLKIYMASGYLRIIRHNVLTPSNQ